MNPIAKFDWNSRDSVLMPINVPLHYQKCTLSLVAARKDAL